MDRREETMALIACAECGHKISDTAVSCPNCGAPYQQAARSGTAKLPKWVLWLVGTPVALFLGMLVLGASISDEDAAHMAKERRINEACEQMRKDPALSRSTTDYVCDQMKKTK
jgi:hypothetical protein